MPTRPTGSRDRHGRGPRGPVLPETVPQHRTRAAAFDDLVLAALDRLTPVWGQSLAEVDPVVVDVPPPPTAGGAAERVPLGRAVPRSGTQRARLVLYRRPIELRAGDQLPALVHAVVVEQVAALLGQRPEQIDPHYED